MYNSGPLVPVQFKKILKLHDCDSVLILSKFTKDTIYQLEQFMKKEFTAHLIERDEEIEEYLGIFTNCQNSFRFSEGHKIMLRIIVKICKSVMHVCDVGTSEEAANDDQVVVDVMEDHNERENSSEDDNEEEADVEETNSE